MTVPTNNEELPSTAFVEEMYVQGCKNERGIHHTLPIDSRPEFRRWLAARRLPVSVDNADARRASLIHMLFDQMPEDWDENDIGILADAIEEWQASHPREVQVTDELRERIADEVGYPVQPDDVDESKSDEFAQGRAEGYNASFENVFAALSAALGGGDRG